MSNSDSSSKSNITSRGQWMVLAAALLGWLFDGAEMGLFSLVGRDAILNLLIDGGVAEQAAKDQVGPLFGLIIAGFLVGAATGGVLFGWLGDRIGRVRAMSLSVITYAVFTGLCGFSKSAEQIAGLRFIAALGMGGEWSLGVALVMEVWPNKSRALMAGLIGAAANVGYLLVGLLGLVLNTVLHRMEGWLQIVGCSPEWSQHLVAYSGWRIMMLLGTLPAFLTFFFRLFVPESEKWHEEKGRGTTSNWQTKDLLGVLVGATGPLLIVSVWSKQFADLGYPALALTRAVVTIVGLGIATIGYLYPVIRFLKRLQIQSGTTVESAPIIRRMLLAAGLSSVALLGTWASTQWVPIWASQLVREKHVMEGWSEVATHGKEYAQMCSALGAIIGTILAALSGDFFGRRVTYFGMCLMSLISVFWMFQGHTEFGGSFLLAAFVSGMLTASFYGWLPLYLPELFGTKFRATGQGFSFNFGRIIAAIGALQGGLLSTVSGVTLFGHNFPGGYPLACTSMSLIYIVGMGLIWTMPETKGQPLPE